MISISNHNLILRLLVDNPKIVLRKLRPIRLFDNNVGSERGHAIIVATVSNGKGKKIVTSHRFRQIVCGNSILTPRSKFCSCFDMSQNKWLRCRIVACCNSRKLSHAQICYWLPATYTMEVQLMDPCSPIF